MRDEHADVAIARWESEAAAPAIAELRQHVTGFAQRHGMSTAALDDVALAVAEAVADAALRARQGPTLAHVRVDAATDGAWLTVQVDDDAHASPMPPNEALPLTRFRADRVEWSREGDARNRVTMEFAMRAASTPNARGGVHVAGRTAPRGAPSRARRTRRDAACAPRPRTR